MNNSPLKTTERLVKTVFVTTSFVGFHCWPEAPKQVAFLRDYHRHKFNVRVEVFVEGSNREVEFFILKGDVNVVVSTILVPYLLDHKHLSCEMMAEFLLNHMIQRGYMVLSVTVDEDGENGATVSCHEHPLP